MIKNKLNIMENVNDQMQEFEVVQPFASTEQLPVDCKKEAVDLGACPNEVNFV